MSDDLEVCWSCQGSGMMLGDNGDPCICSHCKYDGVAPREDGAGMIDDLIKRDDALLPCPFCGGEASDTGFITWSKALPDTHWDDGSEITKAYFCNCTSCSVTNIVGNVGYRTKAEAIAAWNTRAILAVWRFAIREATLQARIEELVEDRDTTRRLLGAATETQAKLAKAVESLQAAKVYIDDLQSHEGAEGFSVSTAEAAAVYHNALAELEGEP